MIPRADNCGHTSQALVALGHRGVVGSSKLCSCLFEAFGARMVERGLSATDDPDKELVLRAAGFILTPGPVRWTPANLQPVLDGEHGVPVLDPGSWVEDWALEMVDAWATWRGALLKGGRPHPRLQAALMRGRTDAEWRAAGLAVRRAAGASAWVEHLGREATP